MYYFYHFILIGKVQGMGCRYLTKKYVETHHLYGSIKNLNKSNQVEIIMQGSETDIQEYIKFIQSQLSILEIKILKKEKIDKLSFSNFEIIY